MLQDVTERKREIFFFFEQTKHFKIFLLLFYSNGVNTQFFIEFKCFFSSFAIEQMNEFQPKEKFSESL